MALSPPARPRAPRTKERREQLLACAEGVAKLAKHRPIKPIPVRDVIHDLEIRHVLTRIVRRWTTRPTFISPAAAKMRPGERRKEHVVPCKVLVDRMINNPSECPELLATAVIIAHVTPEEHRRLGGIYKDFKDLYDRMLKEPVSQLESLGRERYSTVKITLQAAPAVRREAEEEWGR